MYDTNLNTLLPKQTEPSINNSCVQSCIQLHHHLLGWWFPWEGRCLVYDLGQVEVFFFFIFFF